jgi:hypothetical protein
MTGAREVWAEAAARAVVKVASRASGDDSLALVHAALRRSDDAAPEITVVRSSDLADRAAVRAAIFDGHFGRSVREYLSPTGARAFAALDWLPVAELVDALQAELGSAPWPVLVSGPHDAAARAHRRFTPEEMNTLFGGEPKVFPTVDARPLTREALTELVAAFELPDWLATRAGWGLALVPGGGRREPDRRPPGLAPRRVASQRWAGAYAFGDDRAGGTARDRGPRGSPTRRSARVLR